MQNAKMYTLASVLLLILCLLSNITDAQIEIKIQISESNEITIQAIGQSETTDLKYSNRKEIFHITDELLRKALFSLTGLDTEVFIDDYDLYNNYKLEPVKAFLKPNGTKVSKVFKEEIALNKLQAFNHDEFEKSQRITLAGNVEDNVTCVFKQKDVFPAEIVHKVDLNTIEKEWTIKSNFGRDISETKIVPIANANFSVHLAPYRDVTAILSAIKVTVVIKVNYIVNLTGNLLVKFDNSHVWGYDHYDIKTIMDEAGMPHSLRLVEEITIEYYSNCSIKVYGEDIYPSDVNKCSFTVINSTYDKDMVWKSKQIDNFIAKTLPKVASTGNSAKRNSVTTFIFLIFLFIGLKH